jgi:integrase
MSRVAPTMQLFFTERLARQRQASPATVTAYRNTFRLLLRFLQDRTGKAPSALDWDDLGAEVISAFLDHLEADRRNSPRSRNARLAALRSLFHYAALRHPEHAQLIQQVLAIPQKRYDKATVTFLEPSEVDALLAAPGLTRWEGRRDRALIALAAQTGLRLSELTSLRCADVVLGTGGACPVHRERPQAALRPAHRRHGGHHPSLAGRAGRPARRPPVPHPHRPAPQRRRGRSSHRHPQDHRWPALPVPRSQETHTPRAQAHRCHGLAA